MPPFLHTLLRRLTTDVDALRAENERAIHARDEAIKMAAAFKHAADELRDENDRLRVLAGNTEATKHEALMLGLVRESPGLMARSYGHMFGRIDPEYPNENPNEYIVGNNAKHLSSLHKKGLVRREKAGQSYRYWPVT